MVLFSQALYLKEAFLLLSLADAELKHSIWTKYMCGSYILKKAQADLLM